MIYQVGLSVAFFLFVLILFKRNKKQPDFILLTWIGVIVIHLFLFFIHYNGITKQYPHLLGIGLPLPIVHGVFLYFYTRALIGKGYIRTKSILLHLIPFFLLSILAIPFYRLSAAEKILVFENAGRGFEWYSQLQMIAFLVTGFSYSLMSIRAIRRHREQALNSFSNVDKKMLRWLEYLAVGLAIIWLLSAFFNDQVTFVGVVFFVLFIGFFGINQYPVFHSIAAPSLKSEIPPSSAAQVPLPDDTGKYAKSRLNEDEAASVMTLLETVVNTQKPFTRPDLTLNELADYINVSPNHLSQVINTVAGKTYYHYINTYRIEEFLRLAALPESRRFTYLGLAFQCGFTSKTTFNKYFKLQTGKTPSEYFGISAEKAEA